MNGDTLVARITPCLENGKTAYVDFLEDGQIGWGSTEYIVLRPKPPLPTEFAYCLARDERFRDFAIHNMTGSSGRQRVPASALSNFYIVAPSCEVAFAFGDAVKLMIEEGREPKLRYEYWAPKTQPLGTGGDMHFGFSYAVHAALVSVDTDTGEVAVERVVSAHDIGRAINRLSLTGQIEGGIVMGIGNAMTEHYVEENGVPWTKHLGQYKMPGIKHMPEMRNYIVEDPTADGPYGAKGVGEISSIPISPAITNAIYNAVGVRCMALPVDQDALLLAMKRGEREIDRRWGDR